MYIYIFIYRYCKSLSEHMFKGNFSCQQKRHDKMTMVPLFQRPMIFLHSISGDLSFPQNGLMERNQKVLPNSTLL